MRFAASHESDGCTDQAIDSAVQTASAANSSSVTPPHRRRRGGRRRSRARRRPRRAGRGSLDRRRAREHRAAARAERDRAQRGERERHERVGWAARRAHAVGRCPRVGRRCVPLALGAAMTDDTSSDRQGGGCERRDAEQHEQHEQGVGQPMRVLTDLRQRAGSDRGAGHVDRRSAPVAALRPGRGRPRRVAGRGRSPSRRSIRCRSCRRHRRCRLRRRRSRCRRHRPRLRSRAAPV